MHRRLHAELVSPDAKGESSADERARLIGLGERSFHKSYYPELRKRLEELERFRTLLDQANDAIYLIQLPQAVLVDCNESGAMVLGELREEMRGRPVAELFRTVGKDAVLSALRSPEMEVGSLHRMVCIESGEDDCATILEMTITVRSIGKDQFAVVVARDVTQRVQAERALRAAEEKYRSIVENAVEGILQATFQGRLIGVNPALARMLGHASPQDMMESVSNFHEQICRDVRDLDLFLRDMQRGGKVVDRELRFSRKDGESVWVSLTARLIRDVDGSPAIIEGFVTDITARKQAQEELATLNRQLERLVLERTRDLEEKARELEQANQRLLELDAVKNTLVSSVSHELRTPLTSVLGFTRLIAKEFKRSFVPLAKKDSLLQSRALRIQENLNIISKESERLTRMINDFLDLSKIESGRIEWNETEVQVEDVVVEALQAVHGQLTAKPGLRLRVSIQNDLPALTIDPDRLLQVVLNLVNNAVKFTEKGTIQVTVETTPQDLLHMAVSDTGPGIPPGDLEKIFKKFHQVEWDDRYGPKPPGTGLGLAICKQIVEHYNGRIWAEASPQSGAVFHVTLPFGGRASSFLQE